MFSMTKSRELDEMQTPCYFANRRHSGEDVKFYLSFMVQQLRIRQINY